MNVKERLTEYLNIKGISKTAFGRLVGVSPSYINSIRKSIQPDKLDSIAQNYPDLNIDWLMTGKGEMLRNAQIINDECIESVSLEDLTTNNSHKLNAETMDALNRMAGVIDRQSIQIDRLITQVEKSGERADRMLDLIEHGIPGYAQKKEDLQFPSVG